MPALMTLQGPGMGRTFGRRLRMPRGQLRGAGLLGPHPFAVVIGLGIGAYLAYKKVDPFKIFRGSRSAKAWGDQRMTHARQRALSGRRRR